MSPPRLPTHQITRAREELEHRILAEMGPLIWDALAAFREDARYFAEMVEVANVLDERQVMIAARWENKRRASAEAVLAAEDAMASKTPCDECGLPVTMAYMSRHVGTARCLARSGRSNT